MKFLSFLLLLGLAALAASASLRDEWEQKREVEERDVNVKETLKKIWEELHKRLDVDKILDKIKEHIQKLKDSEIGELLRKKIAEIKDKIKQNENLKAFREILRKLLGKKEEEEEDRDTRSLKEGWEKLKEHFKKLKLDLVEKYRNFAEWVLEQTKKHLDLAKDKVTVVRNIAKEMIDHAKDVSQEVANEALDFLRHYKEDLGSLWEQVKEAMKNRREDRFIKEEDSGNSYTMEVAESGISPKEILNNIYEMLRESVDIENIKKYIEKFKETALGQILSRHIEKVKDPETFKRFKNIIKNLLGLLGKKEEEEEDRDTRSIKETLEKIKEWFKKFGLDMKEKYINFAEWLKEQAKKHLDLAKDKVTVMKDIAKEIIDHAKDITQEIGREALDFLRPYKEDLGSLWDEVKKVVTDLKKKED